MSQRRLPLSEIIISRGWAADIKSAEAIALSGRLRSAGGMLFDKPGMMLDAETDILLVEARRFVSRGGDKLTGALDYFKVKPQNYTCLDLGSSTGGFADCLLQSGAKKVYCVDVAYGKLDWKLRNDPRIVNLEKTNFSALQKSGFDAAFELATIDISFSSCKNALLKAVELIDKGEILLLFKPQFEVQKKYLEKGILKNETALKNSINDFLGFLEINKLNGARYTESAVKGKSGNQEYFFYISLTSK